MYSWVPAERARERAVQGVAAGSPRPARRSSACRPMSASKVEAAWSWTACRVPGQSPATCDGHVARRVDPERAGEAARGVDGDDADARAALRRARRRSTRRRSSCRRRPRRRRPRPACPRARRGRRSRAGPRWRRSRRAARSRARRPRSDRAVRRRARAARAGAAGATRRAARPRRPRTARARDSKRRAASTAVATGAPSAAASRAASGAASAGSGGAVLVDDDVGQRHAGAVLDLVGRLDGLVDGELARERDEEHAAPRGVGEQLGDLLGLALDRAAAGRGARAPRAR